MSTQSPASHGTGTGTGRGGAPVHSPAADSAYRRAWWSLALFPLSFVAAFVTGEGILALLGGDTGNPAVWKVLVAATPALLIFAIPAILAVTQGRAAMRLGRSDGRVPAVVGAAIGIGFVGLNAASYLAGLVLG